MKAILAISTVLTAIATAAGSARADDGLPPPLKQQVPAAYRDVGVDQHLNLQLPLDARLYDENGQYTSLGDVLKNGRPIVLQLGYLECPGLCDMISRNIIDTAKRIDLTIGKDFDFVFVSIDPTDTPALATLKQNSYVTEYGKPESAGGFHVLIGKPKAIDEIATAVGFRYQPAPNGQFAHPAVAVIVTPDGRISQYLDGLSLTQQQLQDSLASASRGKIGSILEDIIQICLLLDPNGGANSRIAMNMVRTGGVLTVLGLGGAIFWMTKHTARKAERLNEKN